jgi:hypothetical protein
MMLAAGFATSGGVWACFLTHLQGRPSKTLTSSRSAVGIATYALENPSCPGVGRSKRRDLVRGRSQLGAGSNRGRLPTSLVISLRIGKSSAQARRSNPNAWGRARWRSGTTAGSASQIKVPFTRAALVCPSSATGSRRPGRASSATTSWHPPCNHPAFFPPHRTFTQAEVWCGGKNAAPLSRQTSQHQLAKTRLSSNTSRLRHR